MKLIIREKAKKSFLIAVICALLLTALGSGGYLIHRHVMLPARQSRDIEQLQELISQPQVVVSQVSEPSNNPLESLQKVNPDICGWIRFENLPIDYPVVQTSDNGFYLTHDYKKPNFPYGAIFLDSRCDWQSKNKCLHGHNMNDGSMFAPLLQLTDYQVYEKNRTFTTIEDGKVYTWEIISVFRHNPNQDDFFYLKPDFASEQEFMDFVVEIQRRSLFEIAVEVDSGDELLTLSTCSYEQSNNRTVITGKKQSFNCNNLFITIGNENGHIG